MKKYIGNISRIETVTGCGAFVLSLLLCPAALADLALDLASPNAQRSTSAPTTMGAPTSTGTPTSTGVPTSTGAPTSTGVPKSTSESTSAIAPSSPSAPTNSPISGTCSRTLDRHKTFVQFIEAVTDKPVPQEIQDLLQGVVSLERKGDAIELTKEDGSKSLLGGDTHFGATVIGDFSDARDKVAAKFGAEVGILIDEFVGVTANGSHLEVIRNGPENEEIDLSEHKLKKQVPLKRIRLSKISVDVDVQDSHPVLKNITGIEAVPNAGFEIPIVLREFSRSKNQDGDDVFTFGVKNPLPLVKPFKKLFGIKEIMPLTWTVKKPVATESAEHQEIGAKQPAEQKE